MDKISLYVIFFYSFLSTPSPEKPRGRSSFRVYSRKERSPFPRTIRKRSGSQNSIITWRQTPQGGQKSAGSFPAGPPTMAMAERKE